MSTDTATIKRIQQKLGTAADGIMGPATLRAICSAIGIPAPAQLPQWPTQAPGALGYQHLRQARV